MVSGGLIPGSKRPQKPTVPPPGQGGDLPARPGDGERTSRPRAGAARDTAERGGDQASVGVEVHRVPCAASIWLFALPDLGADLVAAGIGPHSGPVFAGSAI